MADISFYGITATPMPKAIAKILEKVMAQRKYAVVRLSHINELHEYDKILWTYSTMGFLPHGSKHDPENTHNQQPIWLTTDTDNPTQASILVLNDKESLKAEDKQNYDKILIFFDATQEDNLKSIKEFPIDSAKIWLQKKDGQWQSQS